MESLIALSNEPLFPLFAAFGVILLFNGAIIYFVFARRSHRDTNVDVLLRDLSIAREKLIEAEKTGRFGTFSWDFLNPTLSFWSEEMFNLFGLVSRKRVPATDSIVETVHEKDRERAREEWARACSTAGNFVVSFRTVLSTGQIRYVELRGKTLLNSDRSPKAIQGVAHDVTKETEIDRAKSEFVSLASHQLKTPLTSIKWLAESLLGPKSEPLTKTQSQYVKNIHEASRRMVEMVNDLLNVSKIELGTLALRIEEFDACESAKSVAEEQGHAAEQKHIALTLNCASGIPTLIADKGLVRMIIQNLISNAIKYTPEQGKVECELSLSGAKGDMLFVRVTDTGIGIPKDERDKMFEKLYRAQNAQTFQPDGTGLGLYVIKTILDRVKGGITYESTEGKGTTFYVSIPLVWQGDIQVPKMRTYGL